jgi:hypothetical protein
LSGSARPSTYALPAVLLHVGIALGIVFLCAEPVGKLLRGFAGPVSFADEVPSPAWLAPAAFALAFTGVRLASFVRGRPLPLAWTWAALAVLVAAGAGRALQPSPDAPLAWTRLRDAPPALQTAEVLKRLRDAIDTELVAGRDVPADATLTALFRDGDAELWPSYVYAHLSRRPFKLVRVPGASGAVDRKLPGDLAGTIYLAVAPDRRHYWLTALMLLSDNGVRTSDLLPAEQGILVITNAANR